MMTNANTYLRIEINEQNQDYNEIISETKRASAKLARLIAVILMNF